MLPEFRTQLFQFPLIRTTWTSAQNRYVEEKKNSLLPIRFFLSTIEQTISIVHGKIIEPMFTPYQSYFNNLDHFLCSHVDSLRRFCPIVDQTSDEIIERYGDLFFLSIFKKNPTSSETSNDLDSETKQRKERRFQFIDRYFQLITHILMIIEMYSKYVLNELNDYIDTSRNLWKNLNMEDGRSLDEVESFSEKILVLGRRMTGNYRQFIYLIRYQFKRFRLVLFSFLHAQNRFRSTIWRLTKKIQMNGMNQKINDRARYGLVTSRERVRHFLEMMMLHAAKHPWMRWASPRFRSSPEPQSSRSFNPIRPIFFVSSNNTSDCSESEDHLRERGSKIFESTPYRPNHPRSNLIETKEQIEEVLSNISSSGSNVPEQSFDVKEILRQVGSQSRQSSNTSSSNNREDENRMIEQALNESNENEQPRQRSPPSVFDFSPMLASGCAV